jgi:DNA-binding transcriptional ArsR family regulator
MTQYNPDFWEIPTEIATLDRIPADKALWFEDEVDRERRHVMREFFEGVASAVNELIEEELTDRQREIVKLYYFYGKTQEDIAAILNLTQSTVSRHLFGTTRDGKKVGGAIPKLRKAVDKVRKPAINEALADLQDRLAEAV